MKIGVLADTHFTDAGFGMGFIQGLLDGPFSDIDIPEGKKCSTDQVEYRVDRGEVANRHQSDPASSTTCCLSRRWLASSSWL